MPRDLMPCFAIVELDDGYQVIEVLAGQSPAEAAADVGGELADAGPYPSFEEATEALDRLEILDERE